MGLHDPGLDPHNIVAKGWFFSNANVLLGIKVILVAATVFLLVQVVRWYFQSCAPNPFAVDDRIPRKPYIVDQKRRDHVLKQSFAIEKVPTQLDAIVIGSGIGGLSTAAILAKAGKAVLVLEQHDQAGGCCHSYIEKGYEFDVGIHYIGEMGAQTVNKTLVDQISQGQLEWAPLDDAYDVVSIGFNPRTNRRYPVATGRDQWMRRLRKQFPSEAMAVHKFFLMLRETKNSFMTMGMLKVVPLWVSWLLVKTGIIHMITKVWSGKYKKSTLELVRELTNNKNLQTVLTYAWGDYGTQPSKSHFMMQAALNRHYMHGGYYPTGGASEIAHSIIPVIERAGGKVLVRVNVEEILYNGSKVMGVMVKKGSETFRIEAPAVVSSAGILNTFQRLLPKQVAEKSYFYNFCGDLKPSSGSMSVFVGFNASNEDLGLKRENIWAYADDSCGENFDKYLALDSEQVKDAEAPLLFISFPSAKDPNWANHPGRANKSTATLITMANWELYRKYTDTTLKKRGDEYTEMKDAVGHMMVEQMCKLFPNLRNHIDYVEIGSPMSNKHYLAQPNGEIYGLDHRKERFEPWTVARLRPQTDIPGLYLTGQDILTCGFTGALFSGALTAGTLLNRNVISDVAALHKKLKKEEAARRKKE